MKFTKKHVGKWVATKGEKIIATDVGFGTLWKRISSRKDRGQIKFDLVPKGTITGYL